jgi:hypothetical protein
MADSQSLLPTLARERLRIGDLPSWSPLHAFAGRGTGSTCALCDISIVPSEVEIELDFQRPDARGRTTILMHMQCSEIWEQEWRRACNCFHTGQEAADLP